MTQTTTMFRYQGRSMWPVFQDGDLLEHLPCSFDELHVGDCVAYRINERYVVHRVVAKKGVLTTRGDAMPQQDQETVTADQVMGRVTAKHRFGQRLKVKSGWAGYLEGRVYRYAGRIDPQRAAIGGRIARCLQNFSMTSFKLVWNQGQIRVLANLEAQSSQFWMIGSRVVGRKAENGKGWQVAWPWSILVRIDDG